MTEFQEELQKLINRYSQESGSDTPDWILAEYLTSCLAAFDAAVTKREQWYGRDVRAIADRLATRQSKRGDPAIICLDAPSPKCEN